MSEMLSCLTYVLSRFREYFCLGASRRGRYRICTRRRGSRFRGTQIWRGCGQTSCVSKLAQGLRRKDRWSVYLYFRLTSPSSFARQICRYGVSGVAATQRFPRNLCSSTCSPVGWSMRYPTIICSFGIGIETCFSVVGSLLVRVARTGRYSFVRRLAPLTRPSSFNRGRHLEWCRLG